MGCRWLVTAWLVVLCACSWIDDSLVPCGSRLCPRNSVCVAGGCTSPESAAACASSVDGDPCTTGSIYEGTCDGGACHPVGCGNGIRDRLEACDDGNQRDGDGCAADCASDETCGNEVADAVADEECDVGIYGLSSDGCTSTCGDEVELWTELTPAPIVARSAAVLAFDETRNVAVLFGGFNAEALQDTWEYDGAWHRRTPATSPPARSSHVMGYLPATRRVILFGGSAGGTTALGDTWEWDGIQWRERTYAVAPEPRHSAAMAYDVARGKLVLFGGRDANTQALADTWELDETGWTLISASTPILGPRANAGLAYDPVRARVLLWGGSNQADTWEWMGTTWQQVTTSGPSARLFFSMASDPASGRVVLFGGSQSTTFLAETWVWNGTSWSQLGGVAPSGRRSSAMVFDARTDRILMFGGMDLLSRLGDTWELGGTWLAVTQVAAPFRRDFLAVHDAWRGTVVVHGGINTTNNVRGDLVIWDGTNLRRTAAAQLSARHGHDGAFDDVRGEVVTFGGVVQFQESDQTWTWDGTSWTEVNTDVAAIKPPRRAWHAMAYDAARDQVVLFGGRGPQGAQSLVFGDTWLWNGTSWTNATPAVAPPAREYTALAYDRARQRVVLHGGRSETGDALSDTWEWDGTTWTPMTQSGPARFEHAMAYDPTRGRVVLVGASDQLAASALWEWDGQAWQRATPIAPPPARRGMRLVYEPLAGRMLMFGGATLTVPSQLEVYARTFESAAEPRERCMLATEDSDGDGLVGCEDPDCFGRCTPLCLPGTICAVSPRCGDLACGGVEDYLLCPSDCPPPP